MVQFPFYLSKHLIGQLAEVSPFRDVLAYQSVRVFVCATFLVPPISLTGRSEALKALVKNESRAARLYTVDQKNPDPDVILRKARGMVNRRFVRAVVLEGVPINPEGIDEWKDPNRKQAGVVVHLFSLPLILAGGGSFGQPAPQVLPDMTQERETHPVRGRFFLLFLSFGPLHLLGGSLSQIQ